MAKLKRSKTLRATAVEWDWPPRRRARVSAMEDGEEPDVPVLRLVIEAAAVPARCDEASSSRWGEWLADMYFQVLVFLLKALIGSAAGLIAGVTLWLLVVLIIS